MKHKQILLLAFSIPTLALQTAQAQGGPPTRTVVPSLPTQPAPATRIQSFKFEGADLDTVMAMYCEWTHKIYLKTDAVSASISLKADKLTIPECIDAVEAILAMNNIVIVPYGEKFIKVVPANGNPQAEGGPVTWDPEKEYAGTDHLVTQLIPLRNVQIQDVQTAIQHLMHSYGKIQTLEGSNSMLITDTEANILRIRELVDFVDQATARIEPRIYEIHYADAKDVAAKLDQIIKMAQENQASGSSASRTTSSVRTPPGVIRARTSQRTTATPKPTQASVSTSDAGGGTIIQGTVKVMADDRTNLIIIFSQESNYDFFDKMIAVFDVEVEPAITFEVVNLEYADADELAGTLNDLVGAAQGGSKTSSSGGSSKSRSNNSSTSNRAPATLGNNNADTDRMTPNAEPGDAASLENLSKLSESTKILADTRSNSILLMGRKSDIAAIKNVIASLDVMLEQVLIEAAIFEVTLGDTLEHGIDWLYRDAKNQKVGAWNGVGLASSTNAFGIAADALTYYQDVVGIDTQVAIKLAAQDNNVRLLATPVVMTTDNTEASLSIGEQRPVVTSTSTYAVSSGTRSSNYEYKDIGIQLTVTPRINPQRVVVMEIEQKADQVGNDNIIDGNKVPTILNREFSAQIAVPNRGTIALGGLINSEVRDTVTKIPILGDIPLLGRYLFSHAFKKNEQTELVVLMTPYVLTTTEEMQQETERLYNSTDMAPSDWPANGWSESKLQYIQKDAE